MGKKSEQQLWIQEMVQKFLKWRQKNHHRGLISTYEVARWTQEVILETKEVLKK